MSGALLAQCEEVLGLEAFEDFTRWARSMCCATAADTADFWVPRTGILLMLSATSSEAGITPASAQGNSTSKAAISTAAPAKSADMRCTWARSAVTSLFSAMARMLRRVVRHGKHPGAR